ncbi:MAG: hypothetical protein H0V50_03150, partial [Thermoleophilaceae bacterium]|nr:hypothetical protein [Thermoleophilaceae bacterium]
MRRGITSALVLVALGTSLVACGDDDKKKDKTVDKSVDETVVLAPEEVSSRDGASAHSESPVVECSTTDLKGNVGTVAFGGFEDISVRGITCETARTRILDVYKTFDGKNVDADADGYKCAVIDRLNGGLNTIRCVTPDGKDSFRFTAVPKKRRVELASECGTFGRFYDITVLGQSCEAAAGYLENTSISKLTSIPEGESVKVDGPTCSTLYIEGTHRTVRCAEGKETLRFSIATKPSTTHPRRYTKKPEEAAKSVPVKTPKTPTTRKAPKPPTNHGLSPNVIISCSPVGPFDAITAKGINCAAVSTLLQQNTTALKGLKPGATAQAGGFTCSRINSGGQTATVQCQAPSGASFRASFVAPSAPPPPSNPPATTTATPPPPVNTVPPSSD